METEHTEPQEPQSKAAAETKEQPTEQQAGQPPLARREPSAPTRSTFSASPLTLMGRMMESMDRMLDELTGKTSFGTQLWIPQVEVLERDGLLLIRADIPGTNETDVNVEVRNDRLILEGERRAEREDEQGNIWRSERVYGTFHREIPLPRGVDAEHATATFENGVLEIALPLPEEKEGGKRIEVTRPGAERPPSESVH